ncbi:MAG: DNA adenine methylase [Pseudonocardiales bacterium]
MTVQSSLWSGSPEQGPDFRPIQYLGGKWRLLDAIEAAVTPFVSGSRPALCDLFCGTGVVSARLARVGPVLASDIQEYGRVLASALLNPRRIDVPGILHTAHQLFDSLVTPELEKLFSYETECLTGAPATAEAVCELLEHGSIEAEIWHQASSQLRDLISNVAFPLTIAPHSVMTRYYGGVYFSYLQAAQLDALTLTAHAVDPECRDTAIAAVLSTASELVASIGGHFAQPVRPRTSDGRIKRGVTLAVAKTRQLNAFDVFERWLTRYMTRGPAPHASTAHRSDFHTTLSELPGDVGCVYADPPYTRDHYSRFYHVLETLALGDSPGLSTMVLSGRVLPSRGLYRKDRHQSPFCVVSQAPAAFDEIFSSLADKHVSLVLSYSPIPKTEKPRARVMTLPALQAAAKKHFSHVEVRAVQPIAHAKLNTVRLNATRTFDAEVLLIARP